jgi:hypothetical protein
VEPQEREKARIGCFGRSLLVLVLAAGAAAVGYMGARLWAPARNEKTEPVVEERLANTSTVLLAVRSLSRLETVAYHMERVIDLKHRQPRMFGLVGAEDWILLIAVGDVIAGIDLAKLRDGDVIVEEKPGERRVRIRLPAAEVLSASLDNKRTYVHTRKTDMMADRSDQIETRARRLAEDSIREGALSSGILERARQGAEQTLSVLIRSLGFDQVEFMQAER